jgi:transcriptional regulator
MGRTLEMRRHIRVLRLRAEGTKIADIALMLGMTERNVYYVLAEDRATPDPRQMTFLF